MGFKEAVDYILSKHKRVVTITRKKTPTDIVATIQISPSNYFRNAEGPSATIIEGREFVISKSNLDAAGFPAPLRGDRIADSEYGTIIIATVRELSDFGGATIAYRVTTS